MVDAVRFARTLPRSRQVYAAVGRVRKEGADPAVAPPATRLWLASWHAGASGASGTVPASVRAVEGPTTMAQTDHGWVSFERPVKLVYNF